MHEPDLTSARRAKNAVRDRLKGETGLSGVGIGRKGGDLVVQVLWRVAPAKAQLTEIDGVKVVHEVIGPLGPSRQASNRPPEGDQTA